MYIANGATSRRSNISLFWSFRGFGSRRRVKATARAIMAKAARKGVFGDSTQAKVQIEKIANLMYFMVTPGTLRARRKAFRGASFVD